MEIVIGCFGVVYADITAAHDISRENRRLIILRYRLEVDGALASICYIGENNAFCNCLNKDMAIERPQAGLAIIWRSNTTVHNLRYEV